MSKTQFSKIPYFILNLTIKYLHYFSNQLQDKTFYLLLLPISFKGGAYYRLLNVQRLCGVWRGRSRPTHPAVQEQED